MRNPLPYLQRYRRTLFTVITLVALLFCSGCPFGGDKNEKDALREVAKALHRVANATARADEVTYRLYLDGIISAKGAEDISNFLQDINRASRDFQTKARTYTEYNAQARVEIIKLAELARDFIGARVIDGTARIKDQKARENWYAIVNVAHDAFVSIVRVIQTTRSKGGA